MKKILLSATHRIDLLTVLMLLITICTFAQAPTISSVTPNTSVTYRSLITINGSGFTGSSVRFNSTTTDAALVSITDTKIVVAAPFITVTAPATTASLIVRVRKNSVNYTAATLTYFAPNATVVNSAKVSRVHTDWQGYWTSNNTTSVLANQPDRQHSVMAIEYGGITYSTGVADATLTAKGISYTAADFKALPVNSIAGVTPSSSSVSNFFAMASKMDGSATSAIATAPEVAGRKAKDVLIDGIKGLGLGTGMTNMSTSSIFEFVVSDIAESRINDGEPDLVVSQVAEPTTGDNDIYCFVDANGNIVGTPVSVTMQNIPAIGTYKLDLFNITFNSTYDVATLSTSNTSNTTRPIRLVGYKLSDFGITAENMDFIAGFKIMPSGISDPAFIAYNANSMLIPSPKIITHPSSVVACTGTGTSTSFSVTASGINLTYQWKKNGVSLVNGGNISGATTATLNITNVSASDVAFYTCEVTNAAGSVLSNAGYLNTIIAVQPIDNTACLNVTGPYVEVIANGLNLTYQWYSNTTASNTGGTIIPGATNYYYVPPVTATGIKYYYVVIDNNGVGCVRETSTAAKFTVGAAAGSGTSYIGGTAGTNNNVTTISICSGTTATLRNTGSTGSSPAYLWEQSTDGIGGWNAVTAGSGGTTVAYTTPALTETTYYRMRVKTSSCEVYSNVLKVTVGAEAGVIEASSKVICTGTSTTVSVTGSTTTIQWQQSTNGTTWANVTGGSGATTETYTTPVLTTTTYYRTTVTGVACSNPNSDPIQVVVNPGPVAGTISANKSICTGTSTTVRLTGATGTIQWQVSSDNITFTDIPGATNDVYNTGVLTQTRYYRAIVTAVGCSSTTTSSVTTVTVSSQAVIGSVSSNETICSGTSTVLSATGVTGTPRWQQSPDGVSNWMNTTTGTGGSTLSYTTPALTETSYYRLRATNGGCITYSSTITITVTPISAGTAGSNQSVCTGGTATVSVTGTTGSIQWQQSADGSTGWANVTGGSGATTASYTTPALSSQTYYRALVTNGSCSATSGVITVSIATPTAGTASGAATICSGSTTSLSLTGSTGSIQWQQSANGTTGWANVSGGSGATTANYTTAALTSTTYYRAQLTNGSCTAESNVIAVTVTAIAAGTAGSNQSVCGGNTATVSVSGSVGNIQWQQSADGSTNWTNVSGGSGATSASYTTGVLSATTYYRAQITSGSCTVNSGVITVNVTSIAAGTASGANTICSGSTANLSLSGSTGSIQWQQSGDGSTGWANVSGGSGATTANYTTAALTSTTYYRAQLTNGLCTAESNVIAVTVTAIAAGTAGSNQSVCGGNTATVSVSGSVGNIQWQQSADGSTNWTNVSGGSGATSATYTTGVLSATTYYRAQVTSGSCSVTSGVITVSVSSVTTGTASGSTTLCPGVTTILTLSGQSGNIQWQQSADGLTNWVNVTSGTGATTASYTTAAMSTTTYYRAQVTSGSCSSVSNILTVSRNNTFIWNGSVSSDWHTPANWSCNTIPTLADNAIIPQQVNQPIVSQNIMAYAKTLDIQAGAILTINTMRNITVQDGIAVASTGNMIVNNRANLVQITDSNSNNTGNINVKRNSSQLYRQDYTLWSSPVTGQKLFQFSPLTLPDRFYTYRDSARLYMKVLNLSAQSNTTFTKGVAYLIRMPNGNSTPGYNAGTTAITLNQQFTGVPNNGTIHIPVVHEWTPLSPAGISSYGYNGVGNPYPSTINIHSFIDANSGPNNDVLETGTLYFWRKKNNNNNTSYTAINKTGYVENGAEGGNVGAGFVEGDEANWVINPGQGFIVQTKVGAGHIEFNNTMRRAVNNSQFFRNIEQPVLLSRLWLNLTSPTGVYAQTLIGYSNATSDDFDFGYDSPLFTDGVAAMYTKGAGKDLSIQAKGAFAESDVVPLHFKTTQAGQYTINLHKKDGLFVDGQNVYLRDNQANTIQDLNAGSYTFTAAEGVTENRFDVIYVTDGALGTTNPQINDNAIVAYKNNGLLTVSAQGHELDNVKVFDIRGRLLTEKKAINSNSTILEGFTAQEQMLILQIRTTNGATVTKKVIF
jgi:hypothetical protein